MFTGGGAPSGIMPARHMAPPPVPTVSRAPAAASASDPFGGLSFPAPTARPPVPAVARGPAAPKKDPFADLGDLL